MVVIRMVAGWMRCGRVVSSDQGWMARVWGIEKGGIGQWIASMATMWCFSVVSAMVVVMAVVGSMVSVSVEKERKIE